MALSKRERLIAIGVGAAIGLFVADRLALSPYMAWREDARTREANAKAQLTEGQRLIARQTAMQRIWKEMSANGLKSTPSEAEGELLNAVRDWAHESEIRTLSLRGERNAQEKMFQTIGYKASGPGSSKALAMLLWRLESAAMPVRVSELQVNPRKEGIDDLQVQISVSTLCLLPDAENKDKRAAAAAPPSEQ